MVTVVDISTASNLLGLRVKADMDTSASLRCSRPIMPVKLKPSAVTAPHRPSTEFVTEKLNCRTLYTFRTACETVIATKKTPYLDFQEHLRVDSGYVCVGF